MKVQDIDARTQLVVFSRGEEFVAGLTRLATERNLLSARFSAIGAFSSVTLGFFERETNTYLENAWHEQVEVCSLNGNISLFDGHPKVHPHAVIATRDGKAYGGHVLKAVVWPTLELFLELLPVPLNRMHDPETGLALFDVTPEPAR